jgi:hypothetical protein
MATIVKTNYATAWQGGRTRASAAINYYAHRDNVDGQRVNRMGFSRDLEGLDTQAMKDVIEKTDGNYYYRMVLSPGAAHDTELDLKDWTRDLMLELEDKHGNFPYVAIEHRDQTDYAHVHVVMVLQQKLTQQELDHLRDAGTALCELRREIYEPSQTKIADKHLEQEPITMSETFIAGYSDEPDDQMQRLRKDKSKSLDR